MSVKVDAEKGMTAQRGILATLISASLLLGCSREPGAPQAAVPNTPAAPATRAGGVFHEVEIETTLQPAAEYLKLAKMGHEFCNLARKSQGLAMTAFPSVPDPYVFSRVWTVSNGQDAVIRETRYMVGPVDEEACRWENVASVRVAIFREGRLVEISRSGSDPAVVDENAYFTPWQLDDPKHYPAESSVFGMKLRCATPESLQASNILRPMIGMSEMCIAEQPAVFREFDGTSLVLQSSMNGEFFGGRGGAFTGQTRIIKAGTVGVSEATWDPRTYTGN